MFPYLVLLLKPSLLWLRFKTKSINSANSRVFSWARSPLVAKWSETVSHFLPRVSSPPYCMTELSVAMVTAVASSNSTAAIVLLIALGCCWSWVGMIKGMKPLCFGCFSLESFISPSCLFSESSWSETDWKYSHHLLTGDLHKSRLVPATGEGPSV